MSDNKGEGLTSLMFGLMSFKVKAIILGIIGLLFLIILIPILILSLFAIPVSGDVGGDEASSYEEVATEDVYKYDTAIFPIPFAKWNTAIDCITSQFGPRWGRIHTGIDLVCESQTEPKIIAVADGIVSLRTYNNGLGTGYGNGVEIQHVLEDGTTIYTMYAHMKDGTVSLKVGDKVSKGQILGIMGSTGNSTGPHLHFEVRLVSDGGYVNPFPYLFGNT